MIKIIDERGTGKTSRLMLIAKENNAIFVCNNPYAMREKAKAYGIIGIDFISYYDFIKNKDIHSEGKNFVIDEVEYFIKFIAPAYWHLIGYTDCKEN